MMRAPISAAPLTTPGDVLAYLGEALAENDAACLAFALAVVARSRGIALVAVAPQEGAENGPGATFGAMPDPREG